MNTVIDASENLAGPSVSNSAAKPPSFVQMLLWRPAVAILTVAYDRTAVDTIADS